jgi:hypothetical protein
MEYTEAAFRGGERWKPVFDCTKQRAARRARVFQNLQFLTIKWQNILHFGNRMCGVRVCWCCQNGKLILVRLNFDLLAV